MFGIIGTMLLVVWIFDYALSFTPQFMQSPLLALACLLLAADFVRGLVRREREIASTPTPSAIK